MKTCSKCLVTKDDSEFPWKNRLLGKRHAVCKDCTAARSRAWYAENTEQQKANAKRNKDKAREDAQYFIYDYLSNSKCKDCGEYDFQVLTFDHVRGKKRKAIAKMVGDGETIDKIKDELVKCEVVCFNCHMRREQQRRGGGRFHKFWPK